MKTTSFVATALAVGSASAQIPPSDFEFPVAQNQAPLLVSYPVNGSTLMVEPGILFGAGVPSQEPTVSLNTTYLNTTQNSTNNYLLFMLDPDASYPENPQNRWIIHWWQEGLTRSNDTSGNRAGTNLGTRLTNSTAPRVAYRGPRPPTNSSAHRYIQYLFEVNSTFQVPPAYSGYGTGTNTSRFPFEQFVQDANLGDPIAANYFFCSNQTSVPLQFVAQPGEQYPGGNGAMVTQGTNEPSSTASGGASSTSGGSSSTSGGAATTTSGSASAASSAPSGASATTSNADPSAPGSVSTGAACAFGVDSAALGMGLAIGAFRAFI